MRAKLTLAVCLGVLASPRLATAGTETWDIDGFYAAQQRTTAADTTWGGTVYVHPRYWLNAGGSTRYGVAGQLSLGGRTSAFAGGALRLGNDLFFETDLGLMAGSQASGATVVLQFGAVVGKNVEISYAVVLNNTIMIMPFVGVRL